MTILLHARNGLPGGQEGTKSVDAPCGLEILCIDQAELLIYRGKSALARQRIGYIAGQRAGPQQLSRQRLKLLDAPGEQRDRIGFFRKFSGKGSTVAGTRTHDGAKRWLCRTA